MLGAQAPAATPAALPDGKVVATVDGKSLTVVQLRELLVGAPDIALKSAAMDQEQFLVSYYMTRKMRGDAIEAGMADRSPYSDRLNWARLQVLRTAIFAHKSRDLGLTEEDARRYYAANLHLFGTAKVRLLFLAGDDAAVKAKAERLLTEARAGADFAALVAKHSEDPDSAADGGLLSDVVQQSRYPQEVKSAIFATPEGGATLVHLDGAYYLFKVEKLNLKPFEDAKETALEALTRRKLDAWVAGLAKTVEVKIEQKAFFASLPRRALLNPQNYLPDINTDEIKEDTLLAVINGRKMTAADFTGLIKGASPGVRANAMRAPLPFLQQYALLQRMAEEAASTGLDQRQPYRNQIRYNEDQILSQAQADNYLNTISIGPDEQRKAYDDNLGRFRYANVRVLYIPFSVTPPPSMDPNAPKVFTEPEAKKEIESILARIRGGGDFIEMVMQYSRDEESKERQGQIPPITPNDQRVPEVVRNTILNTKAGGVTEPIRLANGFYLFKVEVQGTRTYEDVKDMLYEELRQARFQTWFNGVRSTFQVKIEDATAFRQVVDEATAVARQG